MTWPAPLPPARRSTPGVVSALRVAVGVRVVVAVLALVATWQYLPGVWLDAGSYGNQLGWHGALDLTGSSFRWVRVLAVVLGVLALVVWTAAAATALGPRRRGALATALLSALSAVVALTAGVFTVFSSWYRVTEADPLLLVVVAGLLAVTDVVVTGLFATPGRRAWSRARGGNGGGGPAAERVPVGAGGWPPPPGAAR